MSDQPPPFADQEILAVRPLKNDVDPGRPYAFLVEPEFASSGTVVDVATIFLTNRECPFRCLMCDLWKNTTDQRVPLGTIVQQIDFALERLPPARQVKLYNSGNFFDRQAIPPEDYAAIAHRVGRFECAIVENHPKLVSERCVEFRDLLAAPLEVAMGLETVHPRVLESLNKSMTLDDFKRAVEFLLKHEISVRAFVLLRPPFMSEQEGIDWALRSIEYAFSHGVECCSVIPTRAGNGIMEQLTSRGQFTPPRLSSMEVVLDEALRQASGGRVFMDLWDAEQFASCQDCADARIERLRKTNLTQQLQPPIECSCEALG